jgi:hypothetical protein
MGAGHARVAPPEASRAPVDTKGETQIASKEHPRLITLANHSAYTIFTFWIEGQTFHFVTTMGDHIQVPLSMVERLYPRTEEDVNLDSKLLPARR